MDLRYDLPLSWREPQDESAVTSDWRAHLTRVVGAAAELTAAHPAQADAGAEGLRAGERALESGRRVSIKQLDRAVYGYLDLCEALGAVPELDSTTSGAVALARATAAPTPIRAVIAGHSLHASDAHWSFGRGPELEATAVELLNFLGGRSLQAPRPGRPSASAP
jgi:hypothetical protein